MIIKYIHLLRILISLRAIDVLPVVNLLLYNRNTLYTYNFYSYIFDRCYQLLPHDSMTAATAELGLEVSQALVTLVSVFGYGSLSLLFGLASFTSLRVSDLWDSLCLLEGDRTIKEEVRRRKMRKFADNQTDRQANKHRTFQTLRPL